MIVVCCYWNCIQDFMLIWLGAENVQTMALVFAIIINSYYTITMNPVWMYRETMGLFKEVKYIVLVTAIMNVVLSIILGKFFGMPGILIATTLSRYCSQFWFEPKVLYTKGFERSPISFFLKKLKGVIVCVIAVFVSYYLCSYLGHGIVAIIFRAIISTVIALICVCIANIKTPEFKQLFSRMRSQLKNRRLL